MDAVAIIEKRVTPSGLGDSCEAISLLEERVGALESEIVFTRYHVGRILYGLTRGDVSSYGKDVVGEVSDKTGLHRNILQVSRRLFEHFIGREADFDAWIKEKRRRWYEVEGLLRTNTDPTVLGHDAHSERLKRRVERLAMDLSELSSMAQGGDREALGVLTAAVEEVQRFGAVREAHERPSTARNEEYMAFVRKQPCMACGVEGPSDPHHVSVGGHSIKGTDLSCIPLCRRCHDLAEDKGHSKLETAAQRNVASMICDTLHLWLTGSYMELPSAVTINRLPF